MRQANPPYIPLGHAAKLRGMQPRNLRAAISRGRIHAEKRGRDWFVRLKDVDTYRATRWQGNRKEAA